MSSICIIGGNEPFPECFVTGYRTEMTRLSKERDSDEPSFCLWNWDHKALCEAMANLDGMMIKRILEGHFQAISHSGFAHTVLASPEMYYWQRRLKIYPKSSQVINLTKAVDSYLKPYSNLRQTPLCLGVIGTEYGIKFFTEQPDVSQKYRFRIPALQLTEQITKLHGNYSETTALRANKLCRDALNSIFDSGSVDGIILADFETERWFKGQDYSEHLAEITAHSRIMITSYDKINQKEVFILSAMQGLITQAARESSYQQIPEVK